MHPAEQKNGATPGKKDGTGERVELPSKPLKLASSKPPSQAHWWILGFTLLSIWAGIAVVVFFTG